MKNNINRIIQNLSAFICSYSVFVYQLIVFMNDRNKFSFILLIISVVVSILVQRVPSLFYSLNKIKDADEVIHNQYNDSILQEKSLNQILPSNLIDILIHETISIQVADSFNMKSNKKRDRIKSNFIQNLQVVLVDPPVGKIITPSAFTDVSGQGYLFLKSFISIDDMPVLPKFRVLHEISHSLFLSFSLLAEQVFAPLTYRILIIWIPWQLMWSWQSSIAFGILSLLAFDTWGTTYWSNVKRTLLQSEINADFIAAQLLSDDEKESLLDNLSNNDLGHSPPLSDKNFNVDENYIRFRRLLNFLNTKDRNLDLIGFIAPVSNWDFTWRALLIILLATQSNSQGWFVIFLGIFIMVLLIASWMFLFYFYQKYHFSIKKKFAK